MSKTIQTFKLADGAEIPWLAWGNGTANSKKEPIDAGRAALKAGINHIDTAEIYGTEEATAQVIADTGVSRDSVWVTSKIGKPRSSDADIRAAIDASLEKLQSPPDLFLIHNPYPSQPEAVVPTWKVMEAMQKEGKLKSLGVSNFRPQDFEMLFKADITVKPVAHQLEFHPFVLAQLEPVLKIHEEHNIIAEAYGPLTATMRYPKDSPLVPLFKRIAERLSKDAGEEVDFHNVGLFWCKAKGVVAVTASANPTRLAALGRLASADLNLTPEEVQEIDTVGKTHHFRYYAEHMKDVDETMPVPKISPDNFADSGRSSKNP